MNQHREKQIPHTRIYKTDHDKAITAGGTASLVVYLALCRIHSDAKPEEKDSFQAGAGRIKRHCGLSVRHIKTQLRILEKEGLIRIKNGTKKNPHDEWSENEVTLLGSAMAALGSAKKERENCTHLNIPPKGGMKKKTTPPLLSAAPPTAAAAHGEEKKGGWDISNFPDPQQDRK